ncbi:unnamed protein product [Brachionus calyciflorus]|uniref:Uncharacterized protein n=1 Tax=Brachionus calyciflorus TaxID=104777 RepID=A0A814N8B2_9BILA|nr:unnamed protein product [Brachionus calyciflorus]
MEETWVGFNQVSWVCRGKNRRAISENKKPLFDIILWNVHSRINESLPRTNNFVESWHKAFSSMLNSHPLVYSLIDAFKKEQKKTEDLIIQLQTGIQYKRQPAYFILDKRIQELMKEYTIENFDNFYENLSLILEY